MLVDIVEAALMGVEAVETIVEGDAPQVAVAVALYAYDAVAAECLTKALLVAEGGELVAVVTAQAVPRAHPD